MDEDRPDFSDLEELSEDELHPPANGKPEAKKLQAKPAQAKTAKPDPSAEKPKAQQKDGKPDEDDDDSDEDDDDEEGSDEVMMDSDDGSDSEEGDDEDDSSDEEDTPMKAEPINKRPAESGFKTPAEKKAKIVTPVGQKTGGDGKKVAHVATPHPNKQAGKTPATNDKSNQRTSKSGGQFSCKSCNKSFNSDNALQSHSKAKHSK